MAKSTELKNEPTTKLTASKILGTVPYINGFHFYTVIGNYTEATAASLSEFVEVLRTIDEGSIRFHFPRQDFQKWIRGTIGDAELADRIDKIETALPIEDLRNKLVKTVQTRITELEKLSSE